MEESWRAEVYIAISSFITVLVRYLHASAVVLVCCIEEERKNQETHVQNKAAK